MALQRLFAWLTCSFIAAFQLARSALIFAGGTRTPPPMTGSCASSDSTAQPVSVLPPDVYEEFPGACSVALLEEIAHKETTRRRLLFLCYLVRHGIFNEGFGDGCVPEQYRGSREVQEPVPRN
jgi:hypothetical protein